MSRTAEQVQEEASEIRRGRLEAAGLAGQYDLWRESLPDARIPDNEAYEMFMSSQVAEEAATTGRLSVSTGGVEITADTDIPTPGPDDEETRPDAAPDTSKVPEPDPTGPKLVPGMWQPPAESEALNYEEPSTYQMSRSKDWIENARVLYNFRKPKGETNTRRSGPLGMGAAELLGKQPKQLTDEEIGQWARNQLSGFNWNVMTTMDYAHQVMGADDPKLALAFLNLINMYDHSDGSAMEFAGALGEVASDPTTYAGLGVGTLVSKGVAKTMAKTGLKTSLKTAIVAASAGGLEAGSLSGGFDLTVQNVEQEAGARDDIDYGRAATATGAGVGLGVLLGGVMGRWAGRRMEKFAAEVEKQRLIAVGAGETLDARAVQELGEKELLEMLQSSAEASNRVGERDLTAQMAVRILGEDGSMPRLDDGSIDFKKIYGIMDEVKAENRIQRAGGSAKSVKTNEQFTDYMNKVSEADNNWVLEEDVGLTYFNKDGDYTALERLAESMELDHNVGGRGEVEIFSLDGGTPTQKAEFVAKMSGINPEAPPVMTGRRVGDDNAANEPFTPDIADEESQKLAQKILEMEELERGDVVMRTSSRPGSRVVDELGETYEVVGRTKNGWYKLRNGLGEESSMRRSQFDVIDKAPAPRNAGPMELDPFSATAAKIISMTEEVTSGKLKEVKITHRESQAIVDDLQDMGIDITEKSLASHWSHTDLLFLRNTYNAQALGMGDLARQLNSKLTNEGGLTYQELAMFNNAHSQFVATRDLFYGVSGNAARQLNILRSKPTDDVYQYSQSLMDSISIQGGRSNTERAIGLMADFSRKTGDDMSNVTRGITKMSDNIWGNAKAAAILNVRYNMMLSSWRTHFFNFFGNSASGVYQHLMVSPVRMGINNLTYARELAWSVIAKDTKYGTVPDAADRVTRHQWYAELRGHYAGFRDSLALAKEIAMGRDIGEGKVWNELGLRYNVINVPNTAFGKLGTTPVRLLEAGDAFFKNQYYNSKMHELASTAARIDEVHSGMNYQQRYDYHLDNPSGAMEDAAKAFAAKQTYTNDPNIYGGVLAALADGVSKAQNKSLVVNMIVPFVRTPANLLSYSMEMIGGNTVLSPAKTYDAIMGGTAQESQEALSRLSIAAGLWLAVAEAHENGDITGTGPTNWEERKVWEAAGWQPNSIKIWGNWVSIDRAAPAGQSLATIASVFDYYSMTQQQDKPAMEWIGAGLLYTADMIIDESYLSTASDMMTAISSKQESRARSVGASMINSILVPNLLRDLRRPVDETMRSATSTNLLDQVRNQMMNASPWHSQDLPPARDWKGDPKNYYGNAYVRGLLPFNVRDPSASDPGSMALAYARIPVSTPNKTIDWPGGQGDGVDLFAMDGGGGYVYDKYLEIIGEMRGRSVTAAMNSAVWKDAINNNDAGPNSTGDAVLRKALGIGSRIGRLAMLEFLIAHHGDNNSFKRGNGDTIVIQHPVSVETYTQMAEAIREKGLVQPEDTDQYLIKKPTEGPEFFKP